MNQIHLNRMMKFDYKKNNIYFITICVKNNICCLSTINNPVNQSKRKLLLTPFGKIVKNQIEQLKMQNEYVYIHNYVVMPNHVHLILELDEEKKLQQTIKTKSISVILSYFKIIIRKLIKELNFPTFSWQRINHQHIIQDYDAYIGISEYITTNQQNWEQDPFYDTQKRYWSYPDQL